MGTPDVDTRRSPVVGVVVGDVRHKSFSLFFAQVFIIYGVTMSNVVAGPGDDNCVDDEDTLVGRIEERQQNRAAEDVFR